MQDELHQNDGGQRHLGRPVQERSARGRMNPSSGPYSHSGVGFDPTSEVPEPTQRHVGPAWSLRRLWTWGGLLAVRTRDRSTPSSGGRASHSQTEPSWKGFHLAGGISAETALRLARYFGTSERFWLNLQARHDLEVAKDRLGNRPDREVTATAT